MQIAYFTSSVYHAGILLDELSICGFQQAMISAIVQLGSRVVIYCGLSGEKIVKNRLFVGRKNTFLTVQFNF